MKAVAVIETSTSYGGAMRGGNLIHEVRATLYDLEKDRSSPLSWAVSAGRRHLLDDFDYMAKILTEMVKEKKDPEACLLDWDVETSDPITHSRRKHASI